MPHLTQETLARLADEPPSPAEADHLAGCVVCREELAAFHAQRRELRTLAPPPAPAGGWERLEASLRRDELVRTRRRLHPAITRIAAALAIFVMGALAGSWGSGSSGEAATAAGEASDPETIVDAAGVESLRAYAGSLDPADGDPLARLAILETILITTGAALAEAPADPVINGYHLSAREARDAVLLRLAERDDSAEWF